MINSQQLFRIFRLAGTAGAVITCPLEVLKTRLQANPSKCSTSEFGTSLLSRFKIESLQSNEINAGAKHQELPSSSKTITNKRYNNSYHSKTRNIVFRNAGLNHSHGSVITNGLNYEVHLNHNQTQSLFNPFKNSLGQQIRPKSTIYLNFKQIIQNEGFRGLFKGLGPTLIGVAPYRAIYFYSYANSKQFFSKLLNEQSSILHICSAVVAGFSAVTLTNPIWFIKTRLQLDETRRGLSTYEVMNKILKERGFLGFYKGISASYFGVGETALYFVLYEKLKQMSTENLFLENYAFLSYFTSAGFAKSLSSVICYPHEVARTRLRQEGNKYQGFFQTLALVIKEEGALALYKGMGTHLIRQIPNSAIVMTTYELLVKFFETSQDNA